MQLMAKPCVTLGLVLAVAMLATAADRAEAHIDHPTPDTLPNDYANHNGYVEVYVASNYHGAWGDYQEVANRKLAAKAPDAPLLRRVYSRERAEVWVHKTRRWAKCAGNSRGDADGFTGLPVIRTGYKCDYPLGLLAHEVGHMYGLPDGPVDDTPSDSHHPCKAYWQERSVNVGDSPNDGISGCKVLQRGFGPDDLLALEATY
jgi:hypothetical protein